MNLLQSLEAVVHQLDRVINIQLGDLVSEVEFGHRLGYSDDSEQGTRSNVHIAELFFAFALVLSLLDVSRDDVLVKVVRDRWIVSLGLGNKGAHDFCFNFVLVLLRCIEFLMDPGYMLGQLGIELSIMLIKKKEDQIES